MFWFIGLYTANQYIMSCLVHMCTLLVVMMLPILNDSNKRIFYIILVQFTNQHVCNHILIYTDYIKGRYNKRIIYLCTAEANILKC